MSFITIMFGVALTLKWAGVGIMAAQPYWVLCGAFLGAHLIDFAIAYGLITYARLYGGADG